MLIFSPPLVHRPKGVLLVHIYWLIIAEHKLETLIVVILLFLPLLFSAYFFTHPSSGLSRGIAILPSVCADRPGSAVGIPCFRAEFPVVRGAGSSEEHSLPWNFWNSCGKCSKECGLNINRVFVVLTEHV